MATSTIASILEHHKNICRENKQSHAFGRRARPSECGNQVISCRNGGTDTPILLPFLQKPQRNTDKKKEVAQIHMTEVTWRGDDSKNQELEGGQWLTQQTRES